MHSSALSESTSAVDIPDCVMIDHTVVDETIRRILEPKLAILERRIGDIEGSMTANKYNKFKNHKVHDLQPLKSISIEDEITCTRNDPFTIQIAQHVTGVIGLREALTAKQPMLRFAWAILLCIGIAATVYFGYYTCREYLDEPTLSKVKIQSQPFYDYPPIVLCNDAWFDFDKAMQLGLTMTTLKYALGYWSYTEALNLTNITEAEQEFMDVFKTLNFQRLIDFYKAIAVDLEPVYTLDEFDNATEPSYLVTDGYPIVRKLFLPVAGVCYAFTLPPVNGRLGILYEPAQIILKFEDRTGGLLNISSTDWRLHLSADANILYTWPLTVKSSADNTVMVTVKKIISLDKPGATCVSTNYTAATCMNDCAAKIYVEATSCQTLWWATDQNTGRPEEFCNTFDPRPENVSLGEMIQANKSLLIEKVTNHCYEKCPPLCEKMDYEAILEKDAHLNSYYYINDMRKQTNMSITGIFLLHDAMVHGGILTIKEVETYSVTQLVNNVGGTLGLFVGGALMTIAQVILFCVNYICVKESKKDVI